MNISRQPRILSQVSKLPTSAKRENTMSPITDTRSGPEDATFEQAMEGDLMDSAHVEDVIVSVF